MEWYTKSAVKKAKKFDIIEINRRKKGNELHQTIQDEKLKTIRWNNNKDGKHN